MKNLFPIIAFLFLILVCCCKKEDGIKTGRSTAVFNPAKTYGTVKDIDGNVYKTITLGTQTWMAENLRTTHYQNGDLIPNVNGVTDPSQWGNPTIGAYCSYNNTSNIDSIATFGFLYNGYAITDSRNIAPAGWHVPTDSDWDTLVVFVAAGDAALTSTGIGLVGGRLKEMGSLHFGPTNQADNSSGFTALSGGERSISWDGLKYSNKYEEIGHFSAYWTSTSIHSGLLLMRLMVSDYSSITRGQNTILYGISVRCVKDK